MDFFEAVLGLKEKEEYAAFFQRYLHYKRVVGLLRKIGSGDGSIKGNELPRDIREDWCFQCSYLSGKPIKDVWRGWISNRLG